MSWFGFGKPKSNLPAATPLQTHRSRQIESLKTFNQNVTELQRDVEYRVTSTILGTCVCLHINLPPQFPQEPPLVKVSPALQHPWVNENMIVTGCQSLNSFVMHSDLGQIMQQILAEFARNPPRFLPASSHVPMNSNLPYPLHSNETSDISKIGTGSYRPPHQSPLQAPPTLPARPAPPPPNRPPTIPKSRQDQVSTPQHSYDLPELSISFPDLQELSKSELEEMSNNEDRLLEYIRKTSQFQSLMNFKEKIMKENAEIAKDNLAKEPEIERLKMELLEKFDLMNDLRREFDVKSRKQEALRDQFLPGNFQTQLKIASLQAEEESEQIAENFLDGKMDIDEFKKQFMEIRMLSHCRRAKEERLNQTLASNPRGYDFRS